MMMTYTIFEEELLVFDMESGEPVWAGKPDGRTPVEVLPIPKGDDCIVLVDWSSPPKQANLIRVTAQGGVAWRAQLPNPPGDAYTEMDWGSEGLTGYSWSGYAARINVETGKIEEMEFVK
jgi:hypothetical protein